MEPTGRDRVEHIKRSIGDIHAMLDGKTYDQASSDRTVWLAFERSVEIISEASRKLPEPWKNAHGAALNWHDVANIGNVLRHAYSQVVGQRLWNVYLNDLDPLEAAIDRMLAANANPPPPSNS